MPPPSRRAAPDVPQGVLGVPGTAPPSGIESAMQLIAEGITQLVGFGSCAINVTRGEELEVVAVAGFETAIAADGREESVADILGTRWPVAGLERQLAVAEDWGMFKYVPHDRSVLQEGFWLTNRDMIDAPDAWHPEDTLIAPIYDDDGALRGVLSIDAPVSGRRPGSRQRRVLERFAQRMRRLLLGFLERERLAERAAHLEKAQQFLREAGTTLSLEEVLDASQEALIRGLEADGLWIETLGPTGDFFAYASPGIRWAPTLEATRRASEVTARAWEESRFSITSRASLSSSAEWGPLSELVLEFFDAVGAESTLVVPVGADQQWLGHIVAIRSARRPIWTEAEGRLAMELGRDFGRLVLTSNAYTKERDLADRLREADYENSRLIEAVSRELKAPLRALGTGLKALRSEPRNTLPWIIQLESLAARTGQVDSIVADLLRFSRVSDPRTGPSTGLVELSVLIHEVLEELAPDSRRRSISCSFAAPTGPAYVRGDARELQAAVRHLIDNALTYSHRGSRVDVTLYAVGDRATISVADQGVGIVPAEQGRVFEPFFRGSSPAVGGSRGAGLGLTIVEAITHRHGGTITLESAPGAGTRVEVTLPVAS